MSLERVIRPFQSSDVFDARTFIADLPASNIQLSDDECVLTWTGENDGKYDEVESDLQLKGFDVKWKEDKAERVTEEVRIEQEDNPENYVIVERMTETTIRNQQTGQAFNIQFAEWDKGRK